MATPNAYTMCIALIKPGSATAREWNFGKPVYGIYEGDPAFGSEEIRFGDGSWQRINDDNRDDFIILPHVGEDVVDQLFK